MSKVPNTYHHLPSFTEILVLNSATQATLICQPTCLGTNPEVAGVTCGFMAQQLLDKRFLPMISNKTPPTFTMFAVVAKLQGVHLSHDLCLVHDGA